MQLTSAQLLEEGSQIAVSRKCWSLNHNCVQSPLLLALFEKLADGLPDIDATLAFGLTDNHLGPLTREQFAILFRMMQQGPSAPASSIWP